MGEEMEMKGRQAFQPSRMRRAVILAVVLSAASLIIISLLTINRDTFREISHVSPGFFILAVLLSLGKWMWSVLRLQILLGPTGKRISFIDLIKITYASYFTGIVTPLRAGGVTGEAIFLYEYGLEAGESVAIVGFGAVVSTILLILTFPAAIFLGGKYIHLSFSIRGVLVTALGFGLAFLFLVLIALLKPQLSIDVKLLEHSPVFLAKRQWYVRFLKRLAAEAVGFARSVREILKLGPMRLSAIVVYTGLYWIFGFFTVPMVLVGLGYSSFFWKAVLAQMVVQVLLPFIPTPGASVVGEFGFEYVYGSIVPNIAGLLTLIWRFIDFYLGILIGGIAFIYVMRDINRKPRSKALERDEGSEGCQEPPPPSRTEQSSLEEEQASKLLL
jgi:glycosyltransferase 2 family protein